MQPAVDAVLADIVPRSTRSSPILARAFANVLLPQEMLESRLERAWSPVSHLHSVADSEALREAYAQALEKITEHSTELGQNRELYAAVKPG